MSTLKTICACGWSRSSGGDRRVHGELLVLAIQVAASTAWEILKDAGIDPAHESASTTWAGLSRLRTERHSAA
ncbi:hypothetical protein AB0C21_42335 [Spirillospora sp. NPDC049024]